MLFQIEDDLIFEGLIILQNALKPETTPVIRELHAAKIRTVMVTGDNVNTAISVSRDCGMVLPNENIALLEVSGDQPDVKHVPKLTIRILGAPPHISGDCVINMNRAVRILVTIQKYTYCICYIVCRWYRISITSQWTVEPGLYYGHIIIIYYRVCC